MDKKETNSTQEYRKERKERIAKQAKSSAKKSVNVSESAKSKVDKIVGSVIAVVLVLAIVAGSLALIGLSQKLIGAVTIDGESYSMAELSCYYMQSYNSVYQTAYSYDSQYGEGYGKMFTGYDINLSPDAQTTTNEDDETVTWDEMFLSQAIDNMATVKRYYKKALEAGLSAEDEDIVEEVDSVITQYSEQIAGSNYSLSAYLTMVFGDGVTESVFRRILTEQQLAQAYQEQRQEEIASGYTDEMIEKEYNENQNDYDVVSFRWYTIDVESEVHTHEEESVSGEEESSEEHTHEPIAEELSAQQLIDSVSAQANYNEDTFKQAVLDFEGEDSEDYETYTEDGATLLQKISYSTIETNVSEDAANWLYERNDDGAYVRQAGDMSYFLSSDNEAVYILYAIGTPFRDETVPASVRHILVQFPTEASSEETSSESVTGEDASDEETTAAETTTVSAEVKSECKSEADSILAEYMSYIEENVSGEADEDYFAELAGNLSDDSGSSSDGGLIEDMNNDGSYVPEFEDWVFTEGNYEGETRVLGSTGIIETEYGYHVMFYVGGHDHPTWYETISDNLVSADWEAEQTEFEAQFGEDAIARKEWVVGRVRKACLKKIESFS